MKKLIGLFLLPLLLVCCLSGCFAERHGGDLTALITRVNEALGAEALSAEGFIVDESTKNAYSFIACADGRELLISVEYDQKNRLTACHAVFDGAATEAVKQFLPVYFSAFTQEGLTSAQDALGVLSAFSGKTALNETVCESEYYSYICASTDAGTVITCEKINASTTLSASTQTHSTLMAP